MQWVVYVLLLMLRLLTIGIDVAVCRANPCAEADAAVTEPGEPCDEYRRQAGITTTTEQDNTTASTTTAEPTTTWGWYFEGVDYTIHYRYQYLAQERNNCEMLYIWCLRRGTAVHHVCGYNYWQWRYFSFYSLCELEIYNCLFRTQERNYGVYGTNNENDPIFYNGEGKECKFYYRRASSAEEMDHLYFGGDKRQVLANWIAQGRAQRELARQVEERGLQAIVEDDDTQYQAEHDTEVQDFPGQSEQDMLQAGEGTEDEEMAQKELHETEQDQMELEQMVQDGNNMQQRMKQGKMGDLDNLNDRVGQLNMAQDEMGFAGIEGNEIKLEDMGPNEMDSDTEINQNEQNKLNLLHSEFDQKLNSIQGENRNQGTNQGGMGQYNMWGNTGQDYHLQGQSGVGYNGNRQGGMMQGDTRLAQTGRGGMIPPVEAFNGMRYSARQYHTQHSGVYLNNRGQSDMRLGGSWKARGSNDLRQTTWQNNMGQRGLSRGRMSQGRMDQGSIGEPYGYNGMAQSKMQRGELYGQNRMQYQQYRMEQ